VEPICFRVAVAAEMLGMKPQTLNDLRIKGGGPKLKRLGRLVVYTPEDLKAWVDEHPSFASTTQADFFEVALSEDRTQRTKPQRGLQAAVLVSEMA